jgi:tetratricopeptide (TPR) repeat protein
MTDEHAQQLLDQQQVIIEKLSKSKEKDTWDKLAILSTFVSSIIIGVVGIYFTTTFKAREVSTADAQLQTAEAQVAQRFIPDLSGPNENAKKGALLILSTLSNKELAFKLGAFYASEGTIGALEILDKKAEGENKALLEDALVDALFTRMSNNYSDEENGDQILSDAKRILELKSEVVLKPKNDGYFLADYYRFCGYAHFLLDEYDVSEGDFQNGLKIIPHYYRIYWDIARFYEYKRNPKHSDVEALKYYNLAIEHAPNDDPYRGRGNFYVNIGKLTEALADFNRYIIAYPNDYRGYYAIADVKKKTHQPYYADLKKAQNLVQTQSDRTESDLIDINSQVEELERQMKTPQQGIIEHPKPTLSPTPAKRVIQRPVQRKIRRRRRS